MLALALLSRVDKPRTALEAVKLTATAGAKTVAACGAFAASRPAFGMMTSRRSARLSSRSLTLVTLGATILCLEMRRLRLEPDAVLNLRFAVMVVSSKSFTTMLQEATLLWQGHFRLNVGRGDAWKFGKPGYYLGANFFRR